MVDKTSLSFRMTRALFNLYVIGGYIKVKTKKKKGKKVLAIRIGE